MPGVARPLNSSPLLPPLPGVEKANPKHQGPTLRTSPSPMFRLISVPPGPHSPQATGVEVRLAHSCTLTSSVPCRRSLPPRGIALLQLLCARSKCAVSRLGRGYPPPPLVPLVHLFIANTLGLLAESLIPGRGIFTRMGLCLLGGGMGMETGVGGTGEGSGTLAAVTLCSAADLSVVFLSIVLIPCPHPPLYFPQDGAEASIRQPHKRPATKLAGHAFHSLPTGHRV